MRGKIKKTALILPLIASILALTFAISPAASQGGTTLAVSNNRANVAPGKSFTVDITVHDVSGMLGYGFKLYYDTSILTATEFVSYTPFTMAWPSQIDDTLGLVEMSYSYPLPELFGQDVYSFQPPFPIATITFTVDDLGVSTLVLEDTKIPDCIGGLIDHTTVGSFFSNIEPEYVGLTTGFVESRHFVVSNEPDAIQTLTAQVENMGPVTALARGKFRVVDSMGGIVAQLTTSPASIVAGQTLRLSEDLDTTTLDMPAAYYVEVQVEYYIELQLGELTFTAWVLGNKGDATAAKTTFITQFKLAA